MFKGIRLLAWAALLLTAPLLVFARSTTELRGISVAAAEQGVRVSLEASSITSYHMFTLDKPDRVVIDLRNTVRARNLRKPAGVGPIESVRVGERPRGVLRVVLQLKQPLPASALWLVPPGSSTKQLAIAIGKGAPAAVLSAGTPAVSRVATNALPLSATPPTRPSSSSAAASDVGGSNASSGSASTGGTPPGAASGSTVSPPATPSGAPAPRSSSPSKPKTPPPPAEPPTGNATGPSLRSVLPQHAPVENDRDIIIAVDAGHGGTDPGAIGRNGTREKDVTLAISRALAARINTEPGMRAMLTRNSDYFVVLRDRMVRARRAKADLFVSIHADSIRDRSITGASVYVLSERGASSEAARWLAERENAADLMGGVKLDDKDQSLASVLLDLSQSASLGASMTAAERVLAELDRSIDVRKSHVQQAGLLVLKSPDIPSMLVETGYISNPGEESRLKSDRHQERLAQTIFTGLRGYFEVNPPAGTRLARARRATLAGVMAAPATP